MSKKQKRPKERQFGKQQQSTKVKKEKKHIIDPKHKNTIWTVIIIVVLIIFFIVNNTRETPLEGSYPPNYDTDKVKMNGNPDN